MFKTIDLGEKEKDRIFVLKKKKMRVTLLGLLLSVGTYGGKLQVHFLQSLPLHCVESRYYSCIYMHVSLDNPNIPLFFPLFFSLAPLQDALKVS